MWEKIFQMAIRVYRANPIRPHCNGTPAGHVLLCNLLIKDKRKDCPEGT
jgi:hypothetical protein